MNMEEIYLDLNNKLGLGNSKALNGVWKTLCTDEEAEIANLLPGIPEDISEKSGKNIDDISNILLSLFKKGVAFKATRDGQTTYKLAKNVVQFHDATILWEDASEEFYNVWKKVMDDEFTDMIKSMPADFSLPSFMRVIPINETIESKSTVLSYEECKKMLDESEKIAVVKCPCRLSQNNCDAPLEACIQINKGAEYVLDRGHGRKLSIDEALEILKKSEEAGLVHMQENRGNGNVICNCCSCCCEMFRLMEYSGKKWILAPSRYLAKVNEECNLCGSCVDICPVNAISTDNKDIAEVKADDCMGCGLCATTCDPGAIALTQVRPEEHIPVLKRK